MRKVLAMLMVMLFSVTLMSQKVENKPVVDSVKLNKSNYAFFGPMFSAEWQRSELYPGFGLFYGQIVKNGYGFYTDFTYSNQDSRYGKGENAKGYMAHLGYLQDTKSGIVHWYLGAGIRHDVLLDKNGVAHKYNTPSFNGGIIVTPKIQWLSFIGGLQMDTYNRNFMEPAALVPTSNYNWRWNFGVVFTPVKRVYLLKRKPEKWHY